MKWKQKAFTAIEPGDEFPESIVDELKSLHIHTLQDLVSIIKIDDLADILTSNLNISPDESTRIIRSAEKKLPEVQGISLDPVSDDILSEFTFDCKEPTKSMLQEFQQADDDDQETEFMITALELSEINHIPSLLSVRSQGKRGTCVAFGTVAMREFFERKQFELSEQYLYWGAKTRDGHKNDSGTWIRYAMACLEEDGVCPEKYWPYNPLHGETEHQGPPPDKARTRAAEFRITKKVAINPKSVNDLRTVLHGTKRQIGRIISFAIPVFKSWIKNPLTYQSGRFVMPIPGEDHLGGHCMTLVGYMDEPDWPGGGFFIIRNSWGEKWASESPFGAGYGMLPYQFMSLYGWEAWTAETAKSSTDLTPATKDVESKPEEQPAHQESAGLDHQTKKGSFGKILLMILGVLVVAGAFYLGKGMLTSKSADTADTEPFLQQTAHLPTYNENLSKGNIAFNAGRYDAALAYYHKAVEAEPDKAEGYIMRAYANYGLGEITDAVADFETAIQKSPGNANLYHQLGILYLENGEEVLALRAWRLALEIDPAMQSAANLLSRYASKN